MALLPRLRPWAWVLLAASSSAQYAVDSLSFGHQGQMSQDGRSIPGWHVSSSANHQVQLLSDRLILTPPVPGNVRASLYTENPSSVESWSAELEFRASGQDRPSGNLQLWYVKDKEAIGLNSVHTIENFDGLALLIDGYGGSGGGVRGFLNDGSQNYKLQTNVEGLAFANCRYNYRNLGRPSKLRVSNQNGLTVTIDDQECFKSDQITLPAGYYFAISAATGDNPDSFEINRFVVTGGGGAAQYSYQQQSGGGQAVVGGAPPIQENWNDFPDAPEIIPDRMPEEIKSQEEQFADLHNRLQGLTHMLSSIFGDLNTIHRQVEDRFNKLEGNSGDRHSQMMSNVASVRHDAIENIGRRVDNIERVMEQLKKDVESKDYRQNLVELNKAIDAVKGGLTEHLPDTLGKVVTASAPRMGLFFGIVLAMQVLFAASYIVYKRRRSQMPKKYL